jgi:hypothetical protein
MDESKKHPLNSDGDESPRAVNNAPISTPDIDQAKPRKPAFRILEQEISEGLTELDRSTIGLFMAVFLPGWI